MPGAKKNKGGKSKKAKAAEEAARLAALQESRLASLKELRADYTTQAKLLLRDPLPSVLTSIERAISEQTDVSTIAFSKTSQVLASDLWGINNTFQSYRSLRSLVFTSVIFDDKMLSTLCHMVTDHCGLESLSIIDGKLGPGSARILAYSLPHSNIRQIVLDYNPIASGWITFLSSLLPPKAPSPANLKPSPGSHGSCHICHSQAISQQPVNPLPLSVSLGSTPVPATTVSLVSDIPPRPQRPHCSVERLSARFVELGPEAADALADLLRTVPTVRAIDVSGNHLGPKGFATVCQGIRASPSLETVVFAANAIRIPNAPRPVAQTSPAMAAPAATLPPLSGSTISPTAVSALADGSKPGLPNPLTDVTMPSAAASAAPAMPVPRKLIINPALERDPVVRDTQWVVQGATHLAAHLTGSESRLSLVDLRHNLIGDEAAQVLLDGLRTRKSWLTSGTASGGSSTGPPPVCVYLSERSPTEVFAKHIELNRWMEALQKKRAAAAAKKGKKKKK